MKILCNYLQHELYSSISKKQNTQKQGLLSTADARSSIACFHGVVDRTQFQAMPPMGGGPNGGGPNGGGPNGGGPNGGGMPDIAGAAQKLGITEDQLLAAFAYKMPPDFALAAKNLGLTESALRAALGVTG